MSLILLSNDKSMSKSRFLLELTFPNSEISSWPNPNIVPIVLSFCKIQVDWENDCLDKSMCNIETLEKLNSDPFHFSDIECHHKSYSNPVSIFEKLKCQCLLLLNDESHGHTDIQKRQYCRLKSCLLCR